jgi:hypothetical protein
MPIEESLSKQDNLPQTFELGEEVFDKDGKKLGKVQARFSRYILVERGGLFIKAFYVPHSAVSSQTKNIIRLSLSEEELREKGLNGIPDDLYTESPEFGIPHVSGVALFGQRPLSPAETGHYSYGRRWPGMNTDASGSYRREEVIPHPQELVGESVPGESGDESPT